MKKAVGLTLVALLICSFAGAAFAWEFKMKGETEWRYRYWGRMGTEDIFGMMNADNVNLGVNHLSTFPTGGTQAVGGSTFGVIAGENNFGSDMSATEYRMTLHPKIKVNKAISFSMSVNLTSLGIWSDGEPYVAGSTNPPPSPANEGYVNSLYLPISTRAAGVDIPLTYVTLQYLKTSIKTPMVDLSFGFKNSGLGMGLWKHKRTRASASFGFKSKYGPLEIAFSPYFTRRRSDWGASNSRNEGDSAQWRKEHIRNYFWAFMGGIKYKSGPLVLHIVSDSYREEGTPDTDARFAAITPGRPANRDRIRYRFHTSALYFNGRFFFNAEANWFNSWRSGRASGTPGGLSREGSDADGWLYGIETGVLVGPTKITLNYLRSTGDDITTRVGESSFQGDSGFNDGYTRDWAYLMYHYYGTGVNFGADGWGFPFDMNHVGARVDHAVASNLNVWGLFSYAWRDTPQAWTLGGDGIGGVRAFDNDDLWAYQQGGIRRPVPDHARSIGWEVDAGVNWKLLEGLSWNTTVAYWRPGNWWGYAFPNTAQIYFANGGAGITAPDYVNATFNPGRKIAPLVAVETSLLINF